MSQPILIASDHAGLALKTALIKALPNIRFTDLGTKTSSRVDYPDYAERVCEKVKADARARGVLICGSGIGMSIAANRFSGIRAAVVENPVAARLAREHNHANVLCLGARFLAPEYAIEILTAWLSASPSSDPRHTKRVRKIHSLEMKHGGPQ